MVLKQSTEYLIQPEEREDDLRYKMSLDRGQPLLDEGQGKPRSFSDPSSPRPPEQGQFILVDPNNRNNSNGQERRNRINNESSV